jgi:KaiC/GvpD/RAD55 family RecA-like ATPase
MDPTQAEKNHDWLDAAKSYEQILISGLQKDRFAAETWEKIGSSYVLASRQAERTHEFRKLRQLAVEAYEKAAKFFEEEGLDSQGKTAESLLNAEYARSWLASNSIERRRMLDVCLAFGEKSLEAFKTSGDRSSFGKICNTLSSCLFDLFFVTSTLEEKRKIVQEGMEKAKDAILALSDLQNNDELLFAYSFASLHSWHIANLSEREEERKEFGEKCLGYTKNAITLSKEVSNPYSKAMAMWAGALSTLFFTEKIEVSLGYAEEMLRHASAIKDNYFKGIACYLLAMIIDGIVPSEENPDEKRQRCEEIIRYCEDAIRYLQPVCQYSDIAETYLFYAQSCFYLASEIAVEPLERLAFSKRAVRIGEKGLEYAIRSGSVDAMVSTLHALSKAYYYRSKLEPRKNEKAELLKTALGYRKEYIRTSEQAFSSNFWIRGVGMIYAAQIEADLVDLEVDKGAKVALLDDATSDMRSGVSNCNRWIISCADTSLIAMVADFEDSFGRIMHERYSLIEEKEALTKENEIYEAAAEKFKQVGLPSRVAESYWKIARNLDLSTEYEKAARHFENAFAGYKAVATKIRQLNDFFLDYASYMKAWSEIEMAKHAHNDEKYASARNHYERSSQLLRQSKTWMYLSLNLYAWALLEQAEDLSRKENSKDSIDTFQQAIKSLQESKRVLSLKLKSIDKKDEKDLAKRLIEVTETRSEYSLGRIAIEEAKILTRQGDQVASSEKYSKAAAIFQEISLETGEAAKEAKPLFYLCQAWQKMTLAEARRNPAMFREAAELFKQANEHSFKESASLMALGHSSFCKAMEAGTEFETTQAMENYEQATRHMEKAENFYLEAGFETTSDYAKATQRLFDAYVFMESAKRERDPNKQARFYSMAEEVLKIATECFTWARRQDKIDQVQRLLRKVKEKRELALSIGDIFNAPAITTSTATFSKITSTQETPAGLERFQKADIQTRLVQHETDIKTGETVTLEIQIVNVGKEPVSLIKIENITPAGFQLIEKPDYCLSENGQLTIKGKRINPLKIEELKITLKALKTGSIEVKTRVICVDSIGNEVANQPEPVIFNISSTILPNRIPTGYADIDSLLFGGIPENCPVALASPAIDERELLIRRFLETGAKSGDTTYCVTSEAGNIADLAENFPSNFTLFLCNPRAETMIKNLPNIFKLKGAENLTEIDIALIKSFRNLDIKQKGPRRICITTLSDVLLQHHAVVTRKWLSGLLAELKAKNFTILAVINPEMHPSEECQAILGLFEGEIRIAEKETDKGLEKLLRIRRLSGQRYLDYEISLKRETLEC